MGNYSNYIIGNGIDLSEYGFTALKLPPISIPKLRVDDYEVPGRSGKLHASLRDYEEISKEATLMYIGEDPASAAGFLSGLESFIFSNEPDKLYIGRVSDKFEMPRKSKIYDLKLPLICDPLKRESDPQEIDLANGQNIFNRTNESAYPTFIINGSGTIVLTIGSQTVTLTSVVDSITIDGDKFDCYDTQNANNRMTLAPSTDVGFPVIEPGEEAVISWTGTVSSVVMFPNWRWH